MDPAIIDAAERLRSKHVRTLEVMQQLVNENAELKSQLAAAVGAGKSGWISPEELESRLSEQRRQLETELETCKSRFSVENSRLRDDIDRVTASCLMYKRMFEEAQKSLDACAKPSTCDAEVCTDPDVKVVTLHGSCQADLPCPDCAKFERLADSREARLIAAEAEIRKLQSQLDANNNSSAEASSLVTKLQESERLVSELQHQLSEYRSQLEDSRNKLCSSDLANKDLKTRLIEVMKREEHQRTQISELIKLRGDLQASLMTAESKCEELANEVVQLRDELEAAGNAVKPLTAKPEHIPPTNNATPFAIHVSLTKENLALREQVASMKAERRRYVQEGLDRSDAVEVSARGGSSGSMLRLSQQSQLPALGPVAKSHGTPVLRRSGTGVNPSLRGLGGSSGQW